MRRSGWLSLLLLLLFLLATVPGSPARDRGLEGRLRISTSAENEGGIHSQREDLYKVINFVILAGALVFLLRKPAANFFAQRSASIQKGLEDGRVALEQSQAQLRAIEEKLSQLEAEVAAFRAEAQKEAETEAERLKHLSMVEAEKILESARAQMGTDLRAAKLELKIYGAQQALKMTEEVIRTRLDEELGKSLVGHFIEGLPAADGKE